MRNGWIGVLALAVLPATGAMGAGSYEVTALPNAPDSSIGNVYRGSSFGAAGDAFLGDYFNNPLQVNIQPVLWQASIPHLLPVPDGYQGSAKSINDLGDAAGYIWTTNVNVAQPAVWRNGQLSVLSTLDMPSGNAFAINNQGVAVGMINELLATPEQAKAVMWAGGQTTVLGDFPGAFASAMAINNQGQALVVSSTSTQTQTWIWQGGALTQVTALGERGLGGSAINDLGHVTGTAITSDDTTVGFFWSNGVTTALPNLPGDTYGSGEAMNNFDQIVGNAGTVSTSHAVLWQDGQVFDLNDLIPADSGWFLQDATGIADNGTIVGDGYFDGVPAGFLLTPSASPSGSTSVPEPATFAMLGVASLLLLRRRRRS